MKQPAFAVPRMYGFSIYSTYGFEPDTFVDITPVVGRKYQAARALEDMVQEYVTLTSPAAPEKWNEAFLGVDLYWGLMSGVKYAEAFKELRPATTAKAVSRLGG
jgi:LmbE family N-acetylglucosaminyl deacetylase